jgi:hypothetical protein
LTWYSILTILFRCPATLEACDEASPSICKPYFQLKRAAAPHIQPYYDTYAAPYVDVVRPYYNTVDRSLIAPTWGVAKQYGAPRVHQAQAFSKAQWEKHVGPQVAKYQGLAKTQYDQSLAPHINRVSTAFGPYYDIGRTNTLQTYHDLVLPAYQYVQPHMREGYRATSAFAGSTVVPGFAWAWNKTYVFLDGTIWPQLRAVYVENVEPQLIKIGKRLGRYSSGKKSVPKLVTDSSTRLVSGGPNVASALTKPSSSTKTSSSFTKPAVSVTTTSSSAATSTTESDSATEPARTRSPIEPIPPPEVDEKLEKEDPGRRTAREIVAADLKDWQERYAKAADEGAAEIDERVQEIAKRMIRRNARAMGKSLLEQLQGTAVSELVTLRRAMLGVIGTVNKGGATAEEAQEQIVKAVRQAGMAVKEKAQDVRTWRENYEAEMHASITKAAETHFAILENIRDLALQKIGMKWAWMDGVTYKDWAKYHLLKSRFEEWKGDLENLIVTHPSLEAAQIEGANIEDEAMKVAATTARELARLKQVANWKLVAGDDTSEFDSTLTQQAAEAVEAAKLAAESAADTVVESAREAKDAVVDGLGEGVSLASEAVDKATDAVLRKSEQTSQDTFAVSQATEASRAATVEDTEGTSEPSDAESVVYASEELSSVVEPSSEATPNAESVGSDELDELASSIIFETPVIVGNATELADSSPGPVELPTEEESEDAEPAEDYATGLPVSDTASVKPALFGAAAQSVPSRAPILDDDVLDDVSSAMESMRDDLKSAYSAAMSRANDQYSQALSIVSVQIRGTPKPAHEQMLASVTSAYSKAMASASARMDDALRVASGQLHGTTTKSILPTTLPVPQVPGVDWPSVESIAAKRLRQGRALAEEQYESAKIALGLATPTPSTPAEHVNKMLDNAKRNYYAGLGLAHARYSEFLAGASSALSSMTATPTPTDLAGSASSVASVASGSASSAASVVSEGASSVLSAASASASSAVSVASENASAAAAAGYDKVAAAGDKVGESWEVVIAKISVQVYGEPTPWRSSVIYLATEVASSATSVVGEGVSSVTSAAGAYASAGSEEVAKQYSAAYSIVSELLVGKEPSFSESVLSQLSAAYATGASSASSLAGAAQKTAASVVNEAGEAVKSAGDKVASAASEATEAVKDTVSHVRDEL